MNTFAGELWSYIYDCGIDLRSHVKTLYIDLIDSEIEVHNEDILFYTAFTLSQLTKGQLPDHIHNRMVFSDNIWAKRYVEYLSGAEPVHLLR